MPQTFACEGFFKLKIRRKGQGAFPPKRVLQFLLDSFCCGRRSGGWQRACPWSTGGRPAPRLSTGMGSKPIGVVDCGVLGHPRRARSQNQD